MRDLVHYPNQKVLTGENFAKVKYWLHAEAEVRGHLGGLDGPPKMDLGHLGQDSHLWTPTYLHLF